MNLKHAQYILTIIKEGSITAAAKKLYISQPSLSQIVKSAESALGAEIFNRSTDPISLTYAGSRFVETAQKIITLNQNLVAEIAEIKEEEQGRFNLGIPVQRAMQIIPTVLPKFRAIYPHVHVNLEENGSAMIENMVLNREVDIGCLTTTPTNNDLDYILIKHEEVVFLASKLSNIAKKYPSGTALSVLDLKDEQFICIKSGHSVRKIQERLFSRYEIKPNIFAETISIEVAKNLTVNSNAIMLCPRDYIDMSPDIINKAVTFNISDPYPTRDFYVCYRKDHYIPKYIRDFINLLS